MEEPRAPRVKTNPSSQRPNLQHPLEDAWIRRNPNGAPDPGIRLVGHLRGRPGSAAASSVADRERSRSRALEESDGSGGGETANFATLMARAESAEERHRDDAVEAAGQFIDWQAWWSERVQESSTEEWKQKRMRARGKSQELQKRGKLLQYAKKPRACAARVGRGAADRVEEMAEAFGSRRDLCARTSAIGHGRSRRDWNSVDRGRPQ